MAAGDDGNDRDKDISKDGYLETSKQNTDAAASGAGFDHHDMCMDMGNDDNLATDQHAGQVVGLPDEAPPAASGDAPDVVVDATATDAASEAAGEDAFTKGLEVDNDRDLAPEHDGEQDMASSGGTPRSSGSTGSSSSSSRGSGIGSAMPSSCSIALLLAIRADVLSMPAYSLSLGLITKIMVIASKLPSDHLLRGVLAEFKDGLKSISIHEEITARLVWTLHRHTLDDPERPAPLENDKNTTEGHGRTHSHRKATSEQISRPHRRSRGLLPGRPHCVGQRCKRLPRAHRSNQRPGCG